MPRPTDDEIIELLRLGAKIAKEINSERTYLFAKRAFDAAKALKKNTPAARLRAAEYVVSNRTDSGLGSLAARILKAADDAER